MKTKTKVTGIVLFLSMLACVVPGLSQPAAPANFDPASLPTMVVMTANAIASQTAAAATPTQLELPTLIPTSTATLVPTESVTATPQISLSGTSLLLRDDQTAVFTDHVAGIEFIFPAGWMPLRINEKEYFDAYVSEAAKDPVINDRLVEIQTADTSKFRVDAIDIRQGHVFNGIITLIDFVFEKGDTRSLEKVSKDWRDHGFPYTDYKLLSASYGKTASGLEIAVIEERWNAAASTGVIYYRSVFFKLPSGLARLDLFVNIDFKDTVLPDFEQVINSIVLLNP